MSEADVVAAAFGEVLGVDAVQAGDAVSRYDAAGVLPTCIVEPITNESVTAALAIAREREYAVIPSGHGTSLAVGWPPRRYDVALSTRRMARLVDHVAADMTVTVEAGMTLQALNDALAPAGQWLPLDPPAAETTTLGGLIAADRNGPQRLGYGKVRDYLIGIGVVTADGALVRGGGKVVKNVAGYDLPKLFTGSYGTLAVIVEATFKVRPRPKEEAILVWPADTLACAAADARKVLDSGVAMMSLELVNGTAAQSLGIGGQPSVLVGCSGSAAVVEAQVAAVRTLAAAELKVCVATEATRVLDALRNFPRVERDEVLVARISTLPAELPSLLARVEMEAATRGGRVALAAHAGNGVVWCHVTQPGDEKSLVLFADWLRLHVRELGGWVVFERVPSALRNQLDPWGFTERSLGLMLGIKRALDPHSRFSPGRFLSRI